MPRSLLVDDEPAIRRRVRAILTDLGYEVVEVESGRRAIEALAGGPCDLVVTDLAMPEVDGLGVLRGVRAVHRHVPVVVMTASGRVTEAVTAMKAGATDFVNKPFHEQELRDVLAGRLRTPGAVIGDSPPMRALLAEVERVGAGDASVLITGERGTGKQVIARLVHGASSRAGRPFVAADAGAVTDALVAEADGGTLFVDELGEPAPAALERAMQARQVRVVAAAEHPPAQLGFDVSLEAPALRARGTDVPALARWFLEAANVRNRRMVTISEAALATIAGYPFPGNVRELEHLVERLVVTDVDGVVTVEDLPAKVRRPPTLG
jgi:DNA-binding NtrC family response regulator